MELLEEITYTDKGNLLKNLPFLNETRIEGKLCDVFLKAGDLTIPCHRVLLADAIPYFKAMFLSQMVESYQQEIIIEKIDPKVLESVINFVYTGIIKINTSNLIELMIGSSYFLLDNVLIQCGEFLKRWFHPQNIVGILEFTKSLGCNITNACCDYYAENFSDFSNRDDFLNLELDDLVLILKCVSFQTSGNIIFEAVIRWANHEPDERVDGLLELLAHVQLRKLSLRYLIEFVSTQKLVKGSVDFRNLLDKAIAGRLIDNHLYNGITNTETREYTVEEIVSKTRKCEPPKICFKFLSRKFLSLPLESSPKMLKITVDQSHFKEGVQRDGCYFFLYLIIFGLGYIYFLYIK